MEMTCVPSDNSVTALQSTSSNQEIIKGEGYTPGGGFGAEFANEFARLIRDGKNWSGTVSCLRSATMIALESRISPRTVGSMFGGGFQCLLRRP